MDLRVVGSSPDMLDRVYLFGRKFEEECLNTKSKFASRDYGFLAVQQRFDFFTNL